jgi:polysaccharide export outer membrane protein
MNLCFRPRALFLVAVLPLLSLFFLSSCTAYRQNAKRINRDFLYFQKGVDSLQDITFSPLTIKPNDLLNISVSSNTLNQEQAALFNAANFGGISGNNGGVMINQQQMGGANIFGFLVDEQGFIKYPIIGAIKAAGLSRVELAQAIEKALAQKELVKEPVVEVRYLQLRINVLGEVRSPGPKNFPSDRISILDVISASGDLTERGRRDNILVLREENGKKKVYKVNLLNTDFINSPVFQLQQNDVVYVQPNSIKLKEVNFDPQFNRDLQVGMTVASAFSFFINIFLLLKK